MSEKFDEILQLFQVKKPKGYSEAEIQASEERVGKIPEVLRGFYLNYGLSEELQGLQDELILPGRYFALIEKDYLVFFVENQGVCHAAIKKSDSGNPNPPVYVRMEKSWKKSADKVSDFLTAMFGYQASLCLEYSPEEFYFVTKEEKEKIEQLFTKREEHLDCWLDCSVWLYGDNSHGRISLMDLEGEDIQLSYAANTEEEYERMAELLDGIGEEM